MARFLLTVVVLALTAAAVVSEEEGSISLKPDVDTSVPENSEDASAGDPAGVVVVRVFQPRIFGGIMIRGHCGPILLSRSIPIIARVTYRSFHDPSASSSGASAVSGASLTASASSSGAPWSHGEADGALRAMDSLFTLGHPQTLFRDDFSELHRWHEARMAALDAIRSSMLQQAEQAISSSSSVDEGAQGAYVAGEAGSAGSAAAEERSLAEDPFQALSEFEKPAEGQMLEPQAEEAEWTPANIAGMALLSLAFGLLLAMLLLSLSSLIYGCSEEEPELFLEPKSSVQTPLLKAGDVSQAALLNNPISEYEPPAEKM